MGESYDAFEATELTSRLFTPLPFSQPQNIDITIAPDTNPVLEIYLKNMLTLYAMIPNIFTRESWYKFEALCEEDGSLILSYDASNPPSKDSLTLNFVELLENELIDLISDNELDASWNKDTRSFSFHNCEALLDGIDLLMPSFKKVSTAFANVVFSSANSIYADLLGKDRANHDDCLDISEPHYAITRALKSIVSAFDDTLDFNIVPTKHDETELCRINLGENTPISFEQRFRSLREIYDVLDVFLDEFSGMGIIYSPDETEIAAVIYDAELASKTLSRIYTELEISTKALDKKAHLFINTGELLEICSGKPALKFRALQH